MNYCLGTVQFGMNYGIQGNGQPNVECVYQLLNEAISNNIVTFDTAAGYGTAEMILGNYLDTHTNENIRIITKGKSDLIFQDTIKALNKSLQNLKLDTVYGYLYHDADAVYNKRAMKSLFQIKDLGLSKKVGISVYNPEQAIEAIKYNVDIIQFPYNLLDNRWEHSGFFEKAKKNKIELYARSSLLQGLLLMKPNSLPQNMLFAKKYLNDFFGLCNKYNKSPLEMAIGYVASNQFINYIVFGTDNIVQLKEYLNFRNVVLDNEVIKEIHHSFAFVDQKIINPSLW